MDVFQLMVAIKQVESGGNYRARNASGALGAYQIMNFHLKDWVRDVTGRLLTEQEFLNSPQIQDAVASKYLGMFYDKYGFDGAASMWFSGQADPYSQKSDGYNTVQKYVNKVRGVLGMPTLSGQQQKSTAVSQSRTGTSGGSTGGGTTASIDPNTLAQQFGLVSALINSEPELKALFNKAVAGGWTADKFQASLANTKWWKGHSKSQREYLIKHFTDPASWQRDRDQMTYKINEIAASMGITDLMGTKNMTDLTWNMLYNGWSDAELKYHLANILTMSPEGVLGGQGGQFQNQMASVAWANGVRLDQNWYLGWYKQILQGNASPEEAQRWIRNQAASIFPAFRDQIIAGQNMMDIANPYIQSMGNILEVNAGDIDLFDRNIIGALNYKDPKTGTTGARPLWSWEVELRKDPRWLQTNNAREGMMGVAHKVAQDMGVLF